MVVGSKSVSAPPWVSAEEKRFSPSGYRLRPIGVLPFHSVVLVLLLFLIPHQSARGRKETNGKSITSKVFQGAMQSRGHQLKRLKTDRRNKKNMWGTADRFKELFPLASIACPSFDGLGTYTEEACAFSSGIFCAQVGIVVAVVFWHDDERKIKTEVPARSPQWECVDRSHISDSRQHLLS